MSYDQKPARIKLVSNGGRASVPENAAAGAGADETHEAGHAAVAEPEKARGFPLVSTIVFLFGCAIGGAGLVAWPHLAG
mgnify:CR=1 FL=1